MSGYEDDEPADEVFAVWEAAPKGRTAKPATGPCGEQFCGADGAGKPCPACGWDPFDYGTDGRRQDGQQG